MFDFVLGVMGIFTFFYALNLGGKYKSLQRQIQKLQQNELPTPATIQEDFIPPKPTPPALPPLVQPIAASPKIAPPPVIPSYPPQSRPAIPKTPGPVAQWVHRFFTQGNLLAKLGILILILGVSFFIKIAAAEGYFPLELRLASLAGMGFTLTFAGFRVRKKNQGFSLLLQGAGLGIVFLDIFASFRFFQLLSQNIAFLLIILVLTSMVLLALLQNASTLAILASLLAYSAPILISTGEGNHVALFTYYSLINLAILTIAYFKAWRPLNIIAYLCTFGIGLLWGYQYYQPQYFNSTEPFLLGNTLLFIVISIFYAKRYTIKLQGFVDGTLVFATPLILLGMQIKLVYPFEYGLAYSAISFGCTYLLLALFLRKQSKLQALAESFLAIGIAFATLSVPFAFKAPVTNAFWALEGAGLIWVGFRQHRLLARLSGVFLILITGSQILNFFQVPLQELAQVERLPIFNGDLLGCVIQSLACIFGAYHYWNKRDVAQSFERIFYLLLSLIGLYWWHQGLYQELMTYSDWTYAHPLLTALILVGSWAALEGISRKTKIQAFSTFALLFNLGYAILLLSSDYLVTTQCLVAALTYRLNSQQLMPKVLLLTVFAVSGWLYLYHAYHAVYATRPVFPWVLNPLYLGGCLRSMLALYCARHLTQSTTKIQLQNNNGVKVMGPLLMTLGVVYWLLTGYLEIYQDFDNLFFFNYALIYTIGSLLVFEFVGRLTRWEILSYPQLSFFPFLLCGLTIIPFWIGHPFAHQGWLAWPLALLGGTFLLKQSERASLNQAFHPISHWALFLTLTIMLTWEVTWQVSEHLQQPWISMSTLLTPLLIFYLTLPFKKASLWPISLYPKIYLVAATSLIMLSVHALLLIFMFGSNGQSELGFYFPLFNPVDMTIAITLLLTLLWFLQLRLLAPTVLQAKFIFGFEIFLWLNTMLARSFHQWHDLPYQYDSLMHSQAFQTALSILWSVVAMGMMILSSKKMWRIVWLLGAILLGIVVIKLFTVDLDSQGTMARVISFVGVGLLCIFIGYYSRIPKKRALREGL